MSAVVQHLLPGFDNPVDAAQQVFRELLRAMAEPGVTCRAEAASRHPQALDAASYAIALCLFDQDTRLKLVDGVNSPEARDSLRFHNSVNLVDVWQQADFVICDEEETPDLEILNPGSQAFPDESCTLIIQCDSLTEGTLYSATGPGIEHVRYLRCSGLNSSLLRQREAMAQRFPLGIDIILTCDREFFCLPRGVRVGVAQNQTG